MRTKSILIATGAVVAMMVAAHDGEASSHREAPFLTKNPKVDGTDFYLFNSYEGGRAGFVTAIANYQPLQDPIGGPNYFSMDPEAIYEIHFDSDADGKEDLTFQFQFSNDLANGGKGIELPIGSVDAGTKNVAIPLVNSGLVNGNDVNLGAGSTANINVNESYTLKVIRGNRRTGAVSNVVKAGTTDAKFTKPLDNVGAKTFKGGYDAYADQFKYNIDVPGCTGVGKVFVGQRAESFAVNLGTIFDLINAPAGVIAVEANRAALPNPIGGKNITSIALELPVGCVRKGSTGTDTIVGGWTTASVRQARVINPSATYVRPSREGGAWAQVSRLGAPLVNEVVIGLRDKDRWNSSEPGGDGQFIDYVTNPTLATLIEAIFGPTVPAPTAFPRADLVAAFLTGVAGFNANGSTAEYLRLNTNTTALPVTAQASQKTLGALECFTDNSTALPNQVPSVDPTHAGCDVQGFPNGRRPIDDTVDIALRVMMGRLLPHSAAQAGNVPFHDAVGQENPTAQAVSPPFPFDSAFPYLKSPKGGS